MVILRPLIMSVILFWQVVRIRNWTTIWNIWYISIKETNKQIAGFENSEVWIQGNNTLWL